ncbi:MAG: hypothetical protein ACRC9T_05110, partial [Vibrionaceae bacterium]
FCLADDEARDEIKLELGLQLYEASPDGACMFRCFLAAITRNPTWLSSHNVSREKLVHALEKTGFCGDVRMAIARSLQLALTATRAVNIADHPLLAFGFDVNSLQRLSSLLEPLANLEAADAIYQNTIAGGQFSLWETQSIRRHLALVAPQIVTLLSKKQLTEFAEYLTNLIACCVIEQLNIPINNQLPVRLQADGLHYNLVAGENFFHRSHQADDIKVISVTDEILAILNQMVPPKDLRLKTYQVDNDKGAYPLFRVLLAGITQESFWLSHGCSTELLQDVTRQLDWTNGQLQAAAAITASLAANPANLNATQEQLQKLGFLEHEQGELLQLLTNLQSLGFDAQLWAENGLDQAIWEKDSLRQQLFKGVNDAERGRLRRMFDIRFDRFFDWFGSLIQQQFLNQLGVVYNQPERVHINVESKKPALRAPEDFFCTTADAPRKNHLLLRCSKKYHAQLVAALTAISEPSREPLIAGLNQRWGPQQQDESCDEDNKEDDIAALFTEDYSKSYEAFVKNIAGFNMQEEMRNNASSPLISTSQAIEALGHLAGDAANCLNSTIAEHYNYQLKPHTNPNGRTFASFMDEFTAKAHKGFTNFFEQFTDADIAKEVERLTP